MLNVFMEHRLLTGIIVLLLLLSIICQIIMGVLCQRLIKETDNMAATDNKRLKQCKLRFMNCYQMNEGVSNIPVFVDRFINKIQFAGLTLTGMKHLSGQLLLLSVLASGIGICRGIIADEKFLDLLPLYIMSFLGLYIYFSVTAAVDINGKKSILKVNLVDYLENHMANRLDALGDEKTETDKSADKEFAAEGVRHGRNRFNKSDEKELDELLKEFFA